MAPADSTSKPPAFQFYAADFLLGTMSLSLIERGAYITLLAYQWDHGTVPDDAHARQRILGCLPREADEVWKVIREKFVQGTDSGWRNARLERERQKQERFRLKQSQNGHQGGRPPKLNESQSEPRLNPNESQEQSQTEAKKSPSSSSSYKRDRAISSVPAKYER